LIRVGNYEVGALESVFWKEVTLGHQNNDRNLRAHPFQLPCNQRCLGCIGVEIEDYGIHFLLTESDDSFVSSART
jgi:hypothetical protein